jgi:uncharacterized membrane protein
MSPLISPTGPLATVLILAHVGVGIVGYGTNALVGWDAWELARGGRVERRFLDGTVTPAELALLWVPLLGGLLVALVDPEALGQAWFLVAWALWCLSAAVALAVAWPTQRRLGRLLDDAPSSANEVRALARRLLRAEQLIVVCYVVAFWLMVLKPGNR